MADDHALLVLLPDAIRLNLVTAVLDRVAALGFEPVACRSLVLEARHLDTLYSGTRSKTSEAGRRHGLALTARLTAMDSVLAVVLRHPSAPSASVLLHDSKGASSPFEREPGTLRWLSPLADRCLSLIHTPDDAEETRRDVECLFDPLGFDRVVSTSVDLRWADVEALRSYRDPSAETSRHGVVVRAVRRLATALAVDAVLGVDVRFRAVAAVAYEFLAATTRTDPWAEAERFAEFCRAALRVRADLAATGEAADLLDALLDPRRHGLPLALDAVERMAAHGYRWTDFEQQRLLTSLTFTAPDGRRAADRLPVTA